MTENVRKALDAVEAVLLRNNSEAGDLWNILSALRGPDSDEEEEKAYTVWVRRQAFPRYAAQADEDQSAFAIFRLADMKEPDILRMMLQLDMHFMNHILLAGRALRRRDK